MRLYIASSLKNYQDVLDLESTLEDKGYYITYSWASVYKKQLQNNTKPSDREIAVKCRDGVINCDVLILVLTSSSRGAHIELGIALGLNKKVLLYYKDPSLHISFYSLCESFNSLVELTDKLDTI